MCRWLHEEPAQCTEGAGPGGRWQGTNTTSTILPNITVKNHASSIFDQTISLPWGISDSNLFFDQILEMSSSRFPVDVTEISRAGGHVRALFLGRCHAGITWTGGQLILAIGQWMAMDRWLLTLDDFCMLL